MKVLMLTGSPDAQGSSMLLADCFEAGAAAAGHTVSRFDTAALDIHPCAGCRVCRHGAGACAYVDDMTGIYPRLVEAELVMLVTPVYYFGMTAQLKSAVDRFYALNQTLRGSDKRLGLMAVSGIDRDWVAEPLIAQFRAIGRYEKWRCDAPLLAKGYDNRAELETSEWPALARALGEKL